MFFTMNSDKMKCIGLYKMLPKELWLKITEQLSPDCIINFSMCSKECSKLLHYEKATMLMTKVLPVLIGHFIDGTNLLNCRKVCKKWNKSILTFMKDYHLHRPITKRSEDMFFKSMISPQKLGIFPVRLRTAKDFKKYIKIIKWFSNPLPGNEVEVYLGYNDDVVECVFQGNEWFKIFGTHVLYITFNLKLSLNNILVVYASIREWIIKCPNLRAFSIKGSFIQDCQDCFRIMNTLAVQVRVFKLDFGPFIETLIYDIQNLPTQFSEDIFRALGGTVKKLCFRLDQWTKKTDMVFTQVTELEIENVMSIVILYDFLRSCFPPGAFFSKLKLNLQVTLDWTDILIILRTLNVDSLEIQNCSDNSCNIPMLTNLYKARFKIESLTQLCIFDDLGLSFDFLINFPRLKLLRVCPVSHNLSDTVHNSTHVVRQIDITVRDSLYKDKKPNYTLWLTLPSLKFFLVQKLLNGKETVIKYIREMVSNSHSRVLYVRR